MERQGHFLHARKTTGLVVEGALQSELPRGKHPGAVGSWGGSEQGTRRRVAQGQEIKGVKGKCHSPQKKKIKSFFAHFFSHARYKTARLERRGRGSVRVCEAQHNSVRGYRAKAGVKSGTRSLQTPRFLFSLSALHSSLAVELTWSFFPFYFSLPLSMAFS